MLQKNGWKFGIIKILLVVVVAFLALVAFKDFTPAQTSVEKVVAYEQK